MMHCNFGDIAFKKKVRNIYQILSGAIAKHIRELLHPQFSWLLYSWFLAYFLLVFIHVIFRMLFLFHTDCFIQLFLYFFFHFSFFFIYYLYPHQFIDTKLHKLHSHSFFVLLRLTFLCWRSRACYVFTVLLASVHLRQMDGR